MLSMHTKILFLENSLSAFKNTNLLTNFYLTLRFQCFVRNRVNQLLFLQHDDNVFGPNNLDFPHSALR